ncbi:MAG: BtrH N-terminal domain-containing protein [Anaerolineales bacterium]
MPILTNYAQFHGRHWETGSVHNILAYQGVEFPETGQAISEAMLMGISGGAAFGYFVFDYRDTDPHVSLLSRNTFDPLDTLLERLAIPQDLFHTPDPGKGERNLIEVLEGGRPAMVWADVFSLPYNALSHDAQMWAMMPIVVYGYEGSEVNIADRAGRPLSVTAEEMASARARVKSNQVNDRNLYAEFLDETALILGKPKLKVVGEQFRMSSDAWCNLSEALLPDEVPLLKEAKELLLLRRDLFLNEGDHTLDKIAATNARLREIHALATDEFPMSGEEVTVMRGRLAEQVMQISDIEREAIGLLQAAMT